MKGCPLRPPSFRGGARLRLKLQEPRFRRLPWVVAMRRLVVLAVLALLAPAGIAQAQLGPGEATGRFEPGTLDLPRGAAGEASLVLTNGKLQPVTLRLTAIADDQVLLLLETTEVLLTPTDSRAVRVEVVPSPGLAIGPRALHVRVQEVATSPLDEPRAWNATLTLNVTADMLPARTARLVDRALLAEAHANTSVDVPIDIAHGNATNQSYRLRALLPAGWTATAPTTNVDVGVTTRMLVNVTAGAGAKDGQGRLLVVNTEDARFTAVADLQLTVLAPVALPPEEDENATPPPPPTNGTDDNATTPAPPPAPPSNETSEDGNATTPPPASDPAPPAEQPPPEDEAPLPPAEDEPASDPKPKVTLSLYVQPGLVTIAPGGIAHARLVATSETDAEVAVQLHLPEGLTSDLGQTMLRLQGGTPLEMVFLLEADADLANQTLLEGRVATMDDATGARFQVRIEFPPPPVELTSLSAPDSGDGREFALAATGMAAFAAGIGLSAITLVWTRKKWALAVAGLYARLRPQAVLEHPVRQRIAAVLQAQPGLTIREVQRDLDLANGAMAHHLRTLEKAGAVRVVADGNLRRLYLAGHGRVEAVPPLADRVLRLIGERGETTPGDVAAALGVSRQSVHYHLQKMVREGRLRARVDGRETYLRVAPLPGAPVPAARA